MHRHAQFLRAGAGSRARGLPPRAIGAVGTIPCPLAPSRLQRHQSPHTPLRAQSRRLSSLSAYARAIEEAATAGLFGGEDFYAILGVVAYKAWERRMAAIEERAVAAAHASNGFRRVKVDWSFWTNGASSQYDEQAEQRTAALDPTQRKIANLAASAARAARMWRFYSRTTGSDSPGLLSSSSMSSMDAR
ncbi:hypothetical protein TSOC_002418 [Tetrabaena socialis]|uniref:Uncharacterized protein n=1 Tax=Tetrabaena socialis TaxID=47790 RepID=A0A2J8AE57_9CHLO|nr:hypothetical protein TSOC_002418 [Tetrabaena socialis]|eukprot:PNH10805.1 hypothetical protein TSOC_002418 [Tetrabaena socialis]